MKKFVLIFLSIFCCWQITFAQSGEALHFDGANDRITIGTPLTANSSYTKEAWINPSVTSGNQNIVSSNNNPFWISGNRLQAGNGGNYSLVVDPTNMTLNAWTHVAVTYHAATTTMRLYRNGTLVATNTGALAYLSEPESIGAHVTASFFVGKIDEVRIWKRALSAAEILESATGCGTPASTVDLHAHYSFDQGNAGGSNTGLTTLNDVSGNGNNGTLVGFALAGATSNWVAPGTSASSQVTVSGVQTNVSCSGGSNGAATVTASGGIAPYTYSWSPSGGTGATSSGLAAGTYTVTVTDAALCSKELEFTITQPTAIALTAASQTNIACFGGATGAASVNAPTGGTAPYSYNWTPGNPTGDGTASVSGLVAGTWTCTVTDANACTASVNFTVIQPPALALTAASQTNVACFGGSNGAASVNAPTGGTAPYSYNWTPGNPPGDGTASVSGLTPGVKTCTITDVNGCTASVNFTITQPTAIALTAASQTNIACFGGATGAASVNAPTGGTAPYSYNWTPGNPTGDGTASVSGLNAGVKTCTVTDANGCTATQTFTITQAPAIAFTAASQTNIACFGGATGAASVNAPTGGTAPYSYNWTPGNPTGDGTASVSGLVAGTWTCTVTDANACTASVNFTVTQPAALTATPVSQTNVACNDGSNGSASITASGGTASYTYSWSPSGGTGATATGLSAGAYTVTVTDANGCTATRNFTITQPAALTATSASQTNVSCNGGSNGAATVTAAGGTASYTYSWSPSGGTGATATGLSAGAYTATVTDANGCTATRDFTITQQSDIATTPSQTNVSCNGGSNGEASVVASGGAAPYTYSWSPSGGTGAAASGLTAGNYTLTVTDANACTSTRSFTITQPSNFVTSNSQSNVSCHGGSNGSATVSASGGTAPYTYMWAPSGGTSATATGLSAGVSTVTVTDTNGCVRTQNFTITEPAQLTVVAESQTNPACNGGNGTATVSASGGVGLYTYSWSPVGGNFATASGLPSGTYTVSVTDGNGCQAQVEVVLTQPDALTANAGAQINVSCFDTDNGSATVHAEGGTGEYTYLWSPSGGNEATASELSAGTYTVSVTDANGCAVEQEFVITKPAALTANAGAQVNLSCFESANGSATVIVEGGTEAYTYLWSPSGETEATATDLSAGIHTVSVTDANGCEAQHEFTITQPDAIQVTDIVFACTPFEWIDGNIYDSSNNTASFNIAGGAASGCDSLVFLDLTFTDIDFTTTTTGNTITANESGATYQWIDCDNGNQPIEGDTGQTFTSEGDGNYAVIVTVNSCDVISDCTSIVVTGVKNDLENSVKLYPNPTINFVTIDLGSNVGHISYSLLSLEGRVVAEGNTSSNMFQLDLKNQTNGMYILRLNKEGVVANYKVIKQ